MQSFLDSVLDALPDWDTHTGSRVFVLPSKRAGFFLKNKMAERVTRPIIAPRILSIETFIEEIAGIAYSPPVDLIFKLYQAYLDTPGEGKESFQDFSQWGQVLLQDFNEIDRHLVEADALFETLAALNEIKHWTAGEDPTPMIRRQLAFWKSLQPLYHAFRKILEDAGIGYQGMVYRKATEQLSAHLDTMSETEVVFMGFNALNAAESQIIREMLSAGRARIFWDADTHYVDNPIHDAGLFLRKYRDQWKELGGTLEGISNELATPKEIELVGLPKSVSQAKYCGELLDALSTEDKTLLEQTAVVLSDESMLQPVLHSLPEALDGVNVTMGYPIIQSPFAQLFRLLFECATAPTFPRWPTAKLLEVLEHPHLNTWFESEGFRPGGVRAALVRENSLFCSRQSLRDQGVPDAILELLLPKAGDLLPMPLTRFFLRLIEALRPSLAASRQNVELEYLHHFHSLFSQLEALGREYPFLSDVGGLYSLYQQLLQEAQIDFQGEPLQGLQVMGMLESRNLDFETVILTAVNEGILPAGKSHTSFIPFDVKREFGMPTYKEKDAVYTYHFYRLLQRAKRVFILYNTEPQVIEGGEPSRFIPQLKTDPLLGPSVNMKVVSPLINAMPGNLPEIPKSEALLERLREMARKGFSPTAIASLIEDPLRFYRKNVLRIPDPVSLEETVAANTFGTVLHQAMEDLYAPVVGTSLTTEDINKMKKESGGAITRAFRKHYLKTGEVSGKNLLALEVLKKYAQRYLDSEMALLQQHDIKVLAVEQEFRCPFPVPGLPENTVFLKGLVDRIESVDGQIRIIDYKTGRVIPSQLRIASWEDLISDAKRSKALQILCYAWMYSQDKGNLPIRAGIVSFKSLERGRQWFGYKTDGRKFRESIGIEDLKAFEESLGTLFLQLFDPAVPLVEEGP